MNVGLKRNNLEKYYTKIDIAHECIKILSNLVDLKSFDKIIEPSAGNGSFLKYFIDNKINIEAYDISPENDKIIKQDFLKLDIPLSNILYIGNPPFGRQSCLAKKFIKKCCESGKVIAFILPKSFKKDSFKKSFNLNFHLIYEKDLEDNSFIVENKQYDVSCVFQIWKYDKNPRKTIELEKENGWSFVNPKNNIDIDFTIRRVGVNAGNIMTDIDKSIQSHYFIKIDKSEDKDVFISKYKKHKFQHNNTVGPKSISKQELIPVINRILID